MPSSSIALIDYGMGNLASVRKAVEMTCGACRVVSDPEALTDAAGVILPGVGAFGRAVINLKKSGMFDAVRNYIRSGRPFLGICLGLQLLFEKSGESPREKGLGIVKGTVVRFRAEGIKVPHIGWNTVRFPPSLPLFRGIPRDAFFYFVHSYYAVSRDPSVLTVDCRYGSQSFAAGIIRGNTVAVQFHPEKSQTAGLRFLKNFGRICRHA